MRSPSWAAARARALDAEPALEAERRLSGFRCSVCDGLNGFAVGSRVYCGDRGDPAVP